MGSHTGADSDLDVFWIHQLVGAPGGHEMPHVHGEWNAVTRDKVERGFGGGRFPKCTKSQLCQKNTFWRFNGHDDYSSSVLDTSILLP